MKSTFYTALLKTTLLIAPFTLYFSGPKMAQAGDRPVPLSRSVSSGNLDYCAELPQGSLMVYSATDEFDDGGVLYYSHSSYAIYTTNGKLVKSVENRISRSDEIPEIVTLPVGSYLVEARSKKDGYVRSRVVIKAGHRATVDLDPRQGNSLATKLSSARSDATQRQSGRRALAQSNRQRFWE
jgi:hypothetical protein